MRVFIPLNIFLLWLLTGTTAVAQNCDCDDTANCPSSFGPNFTGQICYDVTDAFNNDLADPNQGICGVNIAFNHEHIWDLELTLISPSGQSVPLVGWNTNFFGTTNNVLWNVLFIPCANIPAPDTINGDPFQAVWSNNQDWPFAAIFDGSYHPVGGNCLEAFDTGPVNGTWCLQIDNQPSPYSGQILNFEIILCDNSGLLCCDADAGVLEAENATICQGDSSLLIDWEPDYGPIYPDPTEYGYSFVVSDTVGLILLIEPMPDLTGFSPGTYSVCGLSFLMTDSLNIPEPDGVLTIGDLEDNLNGGAPWFCGDLTETCVEIGIAAPPAPVFLTEIICHDETYMVGDSVVAETGQYTFVLQNAWQCDSIVNLNLTVLPVDTTLLVETVCFGGSFAVGDSIYSSSGIYNTLLANALGCDSLVILDLTVLAGIETFLVDTICQGDAYAVGDSLFAAAGNYSVLLSSVLGCDSTVYLDLTVLDPAALIATPDTITCSIPQVTLDGSGSGAGLSYQWTAISGALAPPLDQAQVTALSPGVYELMVEEYFCPARDTVTVIADTVAPQAVALLPDTLTCGVGSVLLDGSGSGSGFLFQWLDPAGDLIPGENNNTLWVSEPGVFSLIALNTGNGCSDTAYFDVPEDLQEPFVEAGPGSTLNCLVVTATLDGSQTFQDGNFLFEWEGPGGVSIPWTDSLQAQTSVPGIFYLTATDLDNGCQAMDSVEVLQDIIPPNAEAGPQDTLNCITAILDLNGSGTSNSGVVEFFWETANGHLVGNPAMPDPQVDMPGLYVLTVTDPVNHCTAADSVQISGDFELPLADAGPEVTLTCLLPSWTVGDPDNTSVGPEFAYFWIGPAGDTISTQLSPEIFQGGTYHLFVTNTVNGCFNSDSVVIGQEGSIPIADTGPGGTLTCSNPAILLDGSNSSTGPFIEYTWLDDAGNAIGQGNQLTVGNSGVYCLVVSDGLSLCADTACVEVFQGPDFPLVNAGPNGELDCFSGQAFLQGTVEPPTPDYVYSWSSVTGNILTDPGLSAITVDEPGWYILTVVDTLTDCTVQDSALVTLDTAACMPVANAGADGLINCYNVPFDTLDATQGTSSGLNIAYLWIPISGSVSGDNTLTPVVTEGAYVLYVTNTSVGLTATDTVVVPEDLTFPFADAGPDQVIDCATISDEFNLDGTASSQGANFVYEWTTSGGFIVSGADGLTPLISAPGLYDLQVTDILNGCSSTDAVLITLDGDTPTPCVEPVIQIPCGATSILVGDTCANSNPYAYEWYITGGVFVSDSTAAMVEVLWTEPVVILNGLVTDTTNQCPVAVSMELYAPSACFPECEIAVPDTLTCDVTSLTLDATGSSEGPEFFYFWEAVSGSLCGGETTLFPCVDAPGVYRLTVTDTSTLFTCTQDVVVLENSTPPPVDAGPGVFFTCDDLNEIALQGVAQTGVTYQWSSAVGAACILSGWLTTNPVVACPGVYYLETTSLANGCSAIDSTAVGFDTIPPVAAIQVPGILTCAETAVLLTSQGSTIGPDITYHWTLDGLALATGLANWTATAPGEYCLTLTNENTGCFGQVCDSVFQIADPPLISAGPDTSLTCGITSINLSGDPGAGTGLVFEWSTPDGCLMSDPASAGVLIACPGQYVFGVTDTTTGCFTADSLVVTLQTDPPLVQILPPDALTCYQPQVLLDGSGSEPAGELTYYWTTDGAVSGPVDEATAMAIAPGVYQLMVENIFTQCKDSAFVIVDSEIIYPAAVAGPDTAFNCYHSQVQLDGSASSQGADYTFEWIPPAGVTIPTGANTLFPTVDQPGIYALFVQDTTNGCISGDSVLVSVDNAPPQAVIDHPLPLLITCAQTEIPLSGLASQPSGQLGYSWFSIGGQIQGDPSGADIEALSPGTYFLEVQDQVNGCLDTAFVEVMIDQEPPEILLVEPDTITCVQESVVLDASGTTAGGPMGLLWTGPGTILGDTTLTPEVFQAGVYVLQVTSLNNGCTAIDSLAVEQDTLAPLAQATAGGSLDCQNLEVTLSGAGSSAGPDIQYHWTSQSGNPVQDPGSLTPTVFAPGWYVLTVTNIQNGCIGSAQVEVIAQAFPITGIGLEIDPPTCFGDRDGSIRVDTVTGGSGPFLFSFDGSDLYPYVQFQYLPAGEYFLSVEDANGCKLDTMIFLPNPGLPVVDLGPDQYIQLGETVTVEAITSIPDSSLSEVQWFPYSDPGCPECLEFETTPPHTTTFVVNVRDANGCPATDHMTVFVEKESVLYLPTAFSPNGDGENEVFFPQSGPEVAGIELFQVFDRWGNLVYQAREFLPNNPAYGWDGTFEGKPCNPNVFVWQARIVLEDGVVRWLEGGVFLAR